MSARDPLDALAQAWRALEPGLPSDELERTDAQTQAVVRWMHDAWSRAPIPAVATPRAAARRPMPARPAPRLLRLAAAAAWAVALGALAWELHRAPRPSEAPAIATSPNDERPTTHVASIDTDRVELRHGSVRLVLLTAADSSAAGRDAGVPPAQTER